MLDRLLVPALDRLDDPAPHGRFVSNGRLVTLLTGAGGGYTRWDGLAVTAWSGDRTCDEEGSAVYLRDARSGTVWSVGFQPTRRAPESYSVRMRDGRIAHQRLDDGLNVLQETAIAARGNVELRRVAVANQSRMTRVLDVITYAEVVLHDPGAHAAHPVFSRLFIQTEWDAEHRTLLAHRRPYAPGARAPWLAHSLVGPGEIAFETDRRRFLGRGRGRSDPHALAAGGALSGTVGSVLDPIVAMRRRVVLEPGERAEWLAATAVADARAQALGSVAELEDAASWFRAFDGAGRHERDVLERLSLDLGWSEPLQATAAVLAYGWVPPAENGARRSPAETPRIEVAQARDYWNGLGIPIQATDEEIERTLTALLEAGHRDPSSPPLRVAGNVEAPPPERAGAPPVAAKLLFENGVGGFDPSGHEYVIRTHAVFAGGLPPLPWVNVMSNPGFGCLVSETGAGFTWSGNSREHRLTPWSNDPVTDPHGEAIYLRDEARGRIWSPCAGPADPEAACEVRHGFGVSEFSSQSHGIDQTLRIFVDAEAPVRVVWLTLTNTGAKSRELSVWSYAQLVLGGLPAETRADVVTEHDAASGALLARNPRSKDFAAGVTFAAVVAPARGSPSFTADRTAFLGRNGSIAAPAAVTRGSPLDGRTGAGLDPCAAFRVPIDLPAGASIDVAFVLGEVASREAVGPLVARFRGASALAASLDQARRSWSEVVAGVRVRTPSPEIDLMLNGWLAYQTLSCRLWGRSAFYQSGGAYGFRDQLQDAAGLIYHRPELTRAQIVLHAGHQFPEGDVLHWWHPPADRGTRTRFSDDLVWLPYITAFYVRTTGDQSVLDEQAPFVVARLLEPGEDESYLETQRTAETASVYDHCCRVLDRALTRGAHGLPLMGTGDWNDGMNRVGREGRGESVWLAFFLVHVIELFAPLCERRGEGERAERYRAYREDLRGAIEAHAWDGDWYRRAYDDDGVALGSAADDECRIDAIAQAWAVISGVAPRPRAEAALDAVEQQLVLDDPGMIRLLTPPFDKTPREPGYIKGYVPGIRENGGQYTHGALWVVRALAELGRHERAAELLAKLTPVHHARDRAAASIYQVEPYVVVADIYSVEPHLGRGGWTWYTGSSGWMMRIALESILGLTVEDGTTLVLRPRIPDSWPRYQIEWRGFDGRTMHAVEVSNPGGRAATVVSGTVDGQPVAVQDGAARIPLANDGARHQITITLGAA